MSSQPDPLGAHSSSFTGRRPAASHLPAFQLPGPPAMHRTFPPFTAINASQPPANAGNLLTPPNVSGDGLSPISGGLNSGPGSNPGIPPYTPSSFWQQQSQSQSPYGFSSGATPQSLYASQNPGPNPPFSGRSLYSPLSGSLGRSSNSPAAGDGLPPPHYEQLPPFSSSVSMSAPNGPTSATLPTLGMQQQLTGNPYLSSQPPTTSATQPSPTHTHESYSPHRPPPTPYYTGSQPSSTPHQPSFPTPYSTASPSQHTPLTSTAPAPRVSPISSSSVHPPLLQPAPPPPLHHFGRPFSNFSNYSLPAVSGPIMSNIQNPGASMTLVGGGMPSGLMPGTMLHGGMSHMYSGHHPHSQQQPQNDRPFKCDLCPQSFNRNHDLKRHKRIHLAVKPFPCHHCEKSFSRKDALKRHILVKGCGRPQAPDSSEVKQDDSSSPNKAEGQRTARGANDGPVGSPRLNTATNKGE